MIEGFRRLGGRRITGLGLAVTLALTAAACGPKPAPPSTPSQPSAPSGSQAAPATPEANRPAPSTTMQPKKGGTVRHLSLNYNPPHYDLHQTLVSAAYLQPGLIYSGLLRYKTGPEADPLKYEVILDMAEKWEQVNETTYRFTLRKGLKWQNIAPVNGREVVADDIVYSFERQRTPGFANSSIIADLDKITAVDKYTVQMTTKAPSSSFVIAVANGYSSVIVAKEAVEAGGGDLKKGPNIGTGPFILIDIKGGVGVNYKANPDFYEAGLPYIEKMEVVQVADQAASLAAFRTKKVDYRAVNVKESETLMKEVPTLVSVKTKVWTSTQEGIKVSKPPFNNLKVRQAINKAINRQEMTDTIMFGRGWFSQGFPLPGPDWMLDEAVLKENYKQDIPLAKKLMEEAGFKDGFKAQMKVAASYGSEYVSRAEMAKAYLAQIGIDVNLVILPDAGSYTEGVLTKGEFDLYEGPQSVTPEFDVQMKTYYHSKGSRNANGINDPVLDDLIMKQGAELDPAKRKEMVKQIQKHILDNVYHMTWIGSINETMVWPYLKGFTTFSDYPGNRQFRSYWIDTTDPTFTGRP